VVEILGALADVLCVQLTAITWNGCSHTVLSIPNG
jgi:hypothetical protein